jgi:1,2-dihydroxy-3-keto-5-methylthiopentene dioxygenase
MQLLHANGTPHSHCVNDIAAACATAGVHWGTWPPRCFEGADYAELLQLPEQHEPVLATVAEPLAVLKQAHGYVSEDIVGLTPATPNLEGILQQFRAEHHHADDEVRVILHGQGIFGLVPPHAPPFELALEQGDWIVIPANTRHYFYLGPQRTVIALRVFKDDKGWQAIY